MKNRRRTFEICMTGIAVTLVACNGPAESSKPNIVMILADDMGWGDVSLNGNDMIETPVLNRLKSESLSFERFYVCPLSAPTRSEMLTGRYFLRTGVSSVTRGYENMRGDEVTLAEVLKENRYATGCFGKWHNGRYYLQQRNRENPFLCYVSYNVPHSPFQVPEKYFSKYRQAGLDSTLSSVYGMVENMDDNIGRILEKLEELNIAENTIVIFFSDNGPNTDRYNGGMKGRKGSVDEGGGRVPFYIKWKGIIKSGTTEQLAQED